MKADQEILARLAHKGREALKALDPDSALQIFKDILEVDDTYIDGWVGLAQALYEKGDLTKSLQALDKGFKLLKQKRFKSWPPTRKLAWNKDSDKPVLRLIHQYGLIHYRKGDNKKAKKYFKLEAKLDPNRDAALVMLRDIKAGKKYRSLKEQ